MRKLLAALVATVALLAAAPAYAACTLTSGALVFKDGAGGSQSIANQTDGTNCWPQTAETAAIATTGSLQSSATADGNGTVLATAGEATATLTVNCASCSGGTTVNFEGTQDGTNYAPLNAQQLGITGSGSIASSTTTAGFTYWEVSVPNLTNIRARISGYSAGTVTVTGTTTPKSASPRNVMIAGGAITANAGTNLNTSSLALESGGNLATIAGAISGGKMQDNVAQINGVTPLMGNGVTGTGSPRVTIASDNTAVAAAGQVATGAAPPTGSTYVGTLQSGATGGHVGGIIQCDNHVFKHITSATDTLAVQGVASQTIYVCGWRSRAAGVATWYLENTASANANCSSTLTQLTGVATEAANTGEDLLSAFWSGLKNTSGNGLCINSTGTGGVDVDIFYTQF